MVYIILLLSSVITATIGMYWARKTGRDPVTWFAIGFLLNGFVFLMIREHAHTARLTTRT
jgi:heme/copper-type cytochrome/quinol oxidase subunit 3